MSRKRSDTQLLREEDVPVLYLDENLNSPAIAGLLTSFPDWRIELHYTHFPRPKSGQKGISDPDIIAHCGSREWVLVSCDDRIRTVPINRQAVLECRVKVLMFVSGK